MSFSVRRPLVAAVVLGLAASLGPGPAAPSALAAGARPADRPADHPAQRPAGGPTDAAAVFKWGTAAWRDEFEVAGPRDTWAVNRPAKVRNQHGMLTLETSDAGSVRVRATDQSAREGRWEARVRARSYGGAEGAAPYEAVWELVPATGGSGCDARSIVMADYRPGDAAVHGVVRTLPDREFSFEQPLDLADDVFHTYAVEVTGDHVSWFVDTQVVRTERRPEALSGVAFAPQLRLQDAGTGVLMEHARMQVDWVRHHTMKRPNQRSIKAPRMRAGTFPDPCQTATE